MQKKLLLTCLLVFVFTKSDAQSGCTDPQASNYNPAALVNDGSCVYPSTNLSLTLKANLATPALDETSGITFIANGLWTHNDSGNSNSLYRVDSTNGSVLQTVVVTNATNVDWEDITTGPDYIYIGDFGNNNGNRTNLKLYRIAKSALTPAATAVTADIINFSFSDQTSFVSLPNNNNFDCESVIFYNDSLHLFSKNWVNLQSRHYVLPATPGTWVAQVKESFNTGAMVTGATIQEGGVIALICYDKNGLFPVYLWMLYDHHSGLFFNGNKRKFNLSSMLVNGQTEGISFKNGAYGYITNERLQQNPINIAPALKSFNLGTYLPPAFINPPPVAGFTVSDNSICKFQTVSFTDQSSANTLSRNWSFPGGTPSTSTLANPVVSYSVPGTYDVTLVAGNLNGTDTLTINGQVTVSALPAVTIIPSGPLNFCQGGSVNLLANAPSAIQYQWKKNGNIISGTNASGYLAAASGTYKVIVTNAAGCTKASATVVVTGPPPASFTASGPLSFCAGDSVVFTANTGTGYSWQWKKNGNAINGATAINYTAKTNGSYRVVVTNANGCSTTSNTKAVTVSCRTSESTEANLIRMYPNPSSTFLHLEVAEDVPGPFELSIFSLTGQVVKNIQLTGNPSVLSIAELRSGFYQLRLTGADGNSYFKKLIKE